MLVPADLAVFVLFFQPAHQRFEVFHHRASGNVFAGGLLYKQPPALNRGLFHDDIALHLSMKCAEVRKRTGLSECVAPRGSHID